MPTATVTSKGRITIPKVVRETLRLERGDRVVFRLRCDGVVEMVPETFDLLSLRGSLKPAVRGVTVEAMNAAIRAAAGDGD